MSFSDAVARMDAAIIDKLGDGQAIYNNRQLVDVILEKDVQRVSDEGEIYFNQFEITTFNKQARIEPGKTIKLCGATYTVVDIIKNDGSMTVCTARL